MKHSAEKLELVKLWPSSAAWGLSGAAGVVFSFTVHWFRSPSTLHSLESETLIFTEAAEESGGLDLHMHCGAVRDLDIHKSHVIDWNLGGLERPGILWRDVIHRGYVIHKGCIGLRAGVHRTQHAKGCKTNIAWDAFFGDPDFLGFDPFPFPFGLKLGHS